MSVPTPYLLATDALVEYEKDGVEGLLLIFRGNEPKKWAKPGGFVDPGESAGEAIVRELHEELSLEHIEEFDETVPYRVRTSWGRDERSDPDLAWTQVNCIIYKLRGRGSYTAGDDAALARFFGDDELVNLVKTQGIEYFAFDHGKDIKEYLIGKRCMKRFSRVGFIARNKPLHIGGAKVLDALCENSDEVLLGIGSSNKYNMRNPFTAEESREMIDAYLSKRFDNYTFVDVPDFGQNPAFRNGQKWREFVLEKFVDLEMFFTANGYCAKLLSQDYSLLHPASLIDRKDWVKVSATMVRESMARDERWRELVPKEVAEYLREKKLVRRFCKEFGKETLLAGANSVNNTLNGAQREQQHTWEI